MKDSRLDIQPGAYTYNHILDCVSSCFVKSSSPLRNYFDYTVDSHFISRRINQWAKSEIKGCAERAVKLFRELRDPGAAFFSSFFSRHVRVLTGFHHQFTKHKRNLDEFSYNTLLHCFSKESDQWASYADDILQEMKDKKISIGQVTYHGMMNIHAKNSSKDGAKKAEIFLRGMESEGLSPGEMSYNICIDAYARRGDHRKAQSLLEEMISLSDNGNVECRPSIHSFAAVVNALAKSGDANAVARAEEVVRRVEGLDYVTPNTILYNSLIDCMVKSRRKDNSLQAEDILLRMEQMYRSGNNNVRPNSYAYRYGIFDVNIVFFIFHRLSGLIFMFHSLSQHGTDVLCTQ
jgi:pentatricopeptide repeat protein